VQGCIHRALNSSRLNHEPAKVKTEI